MSDRELFSNCPRCGLSIQPRVGWLTVEHCPRCTAQARIAVRLLCLPLPAAELYSEGHSQAPSRAA
jgi:hypothetical protein